MEARQLKAARLHNEFYTAHVYLFQNCDGVYSISYSVGDLDNMAFEGSFERGDKEETNKDCAYFEYLHTLYTLKERFHFDNDILGDC